MQNRLSLVTVALILGACGGGDSGGGGGDDMANPVDARPGNPDAATPPGTPDAAPPTTPDATPEPSQCGTATPDVSGITGTEGLAIAPDGTIYFSQSGAVGRLRPGQQPERTWATLPRGTVWGLALTATHLYAGHRNDQSIWRVDLATADEEEWIGDAGQPNGVIIGADGALYYSDFAGGQVWRVDLTTKERTQVTAASPRQAIARPNGLYSVDATHLLVLSYGTGEVWELTLRDGAETARVSKTDVAGNLDGITRGADGRWYLTDNSGGRVLQRNADLSAPAGGGEIETDVGGAANLVFGRGALSCDDLYVTSTDELRRITVRP